jgi:RNA polymerase sigma-70 factor (ECF subfamily)
MFYRHALSVALPYSFDEEEAREIVNDAFLKAFLSIDRYDPVFSFATWLRTIVVRTAINRYYSSKNELVLFDPTDPIEASVDEEVIAQLEAEDLLKCVQRLPPSYRMVFNLYVLEGYTHQEIAELLDISIGTSKSNFFKAKARLKKMLVDYLPKRHG